ncbi:MAG: hypothetical protein ACRBK7_03615 [Acidimicrobiales bacterium]
MGESVNYRDLMTRFRWAFASADAELLDGVLGAGFQWHTHTFDPNNPVPTGRVLHGVAEMVEELEWRKANWVGVRFEGLNEHFAPKLITQSFTISGLDRGTRFHVAAIDIYTLNDADLIVKKDTYWKQATR